VDHRKEIRDFLVSRRARVTPEQAGLPSYGGKRRVPGLRREEVAMLAGLSVDYYGRLERGNLAGHRSRCWRLWPVLCGSTTRNGSTCSIGSDEFVVRWARQNVRLNRTARKRLHNRVVGEIELTGNALELPIRYEAGLLFPA